MNKRKQVTLPPELPLGTLLTEVTRAYLHHGLPWRVLYRVALGVEQFLREYPYDDQDRRLFAEFQVELEALRVKWRKKAEGTYLPKKAAADE
jgi:hypothetical protein